MANKMTASELKHQYETNIDGMFFTRNKKQKVKIK